MRSLRAKIGRYPHTAALMDRAMDLAGARVVFESTTPGLTAREMVRELAHDICELPVVNYFSAHEHGVPITAVPVFLTRRFPHRTVICNRRTGALEPKDLEGRSIGIGYYGNTDTIWVQGMLTVQFGVDCDRITWVASQEEQLLGAAVPPNVGRIAEKAETLATDALPAPALGQMLHAGELAAVVYGRPPIEDPDPDVRPLFSDADRYEREWFISTGVFPVLHTLAVRNEVLDRHPGLISALFAVFRRAKHKAMIDLASGIPLNSTLITAAHMSGFPTASPPPPDRAYLGSDPLPYGIEANRSNLEMILRFAHERHVLQRLPTLNELFPQVDGEAQPPC